MRKTYSSIKANIKRNILLEHLQAKGIDKSRDGRSIYNLNDDELKHELVMSNYRDIDIESGAQKWF